MIRVGLRWILVAVIVLAGCHSACFQTAKIRNGTDATFGITKIDAADNPDVSDYSIYIRGEVGREARRSRIGYSFAMTFVSPLRNTYRTTFTSPEPDIDVFPNEWVGVLPEFKLQIPRVLPLDIALDFRLIGYLPERAAVLASYDAADFLTLYGSWSYAVAAAPQLCLGTEVNLTRNLSVFMEYATWLSDHDYPDDFSGSVIRRPYSIGMAVCRHWPRPPDEYDSHKFTATPRSPTVVAQ